MLLSYLIELPCHLSVEKVSFLLSLQAELLALSKVWEERCKPSELRLWGRGIVRAADGWGIQSGKDRLGNKLQQLDRFEEMVC